MENLPEKRALLRMGYAMIAFCGDSFRQVPHRIVLDADATFDAAHRGHLSRLFNANPALSCCWRIWIASYPCYSQRCIGSGRCSYPTCSGFFGVNFQRAR